MKSFDIKTKVYFGDNALDRLSEIPYKKVLVITDPFLAQSSMINLITDPLKKGHIEYDIFQDVVPDPPIFSSVYARNTRNRIHKCIQEIIFLP